MGAPDVLAYLSALGLHVTREGTDIRAWPKAALTDEARNLIRAHKAELLDVLSLEQRHEPPPDPAAENRRREVLDMLSQNPTARYAFQTDLEADPEIVLLTLAIRGEATCELRILRAKYDGFLLFDLVRRHSGAVH